MLLAARSYPTQAGAASASANFTGEAQFGLDWLRKMWNDTTRTLYYQVGLGDGNGTTILGDHDLWRLPEKDDDKLPAPSERYEKQRPVFRAAAPSVNRWRASS